MWTCDYPCARPGASLGGLLLTLSVSLAPCSTIHAGVILGVDHDSANGDLYSLSPVDGSATLIGQTGVAATTALASDRDSGTVWGLRNNSSGLYTVNTTTGAWSHVGDADRTWHYPGAAFDPNQNVLYVASRNTISSLYTVNVTSGEETLVGSTGQSFMNSLAYDSTNDVLYAVSDSTDTLYSLNTSTGARTGIGRSMWDSLVWPTTGSRTSCTCTKT